MLHAFLNRGARAEFGTDEDKECLRYVLNEEAGSSVISFQVCCTTRLVKPLFGVKRQNSSALQPPLSCF